MVDDVVHLELYKHNQSKSVNQLLVEDRKAERCEESVLSQVCISAFFLFWKSFV